MNKELCYIVSRDKTRPCSGEYLETRVYALATKVMQVVPRSGVEKINPERSHIIAWSSTMSEYDMAMEQLRAGRIPTFPEGE